MKPTRTIDFAQDFAAGREQVALARKALDLLVEAAALASLPLRDHQRVQAGAAVISAVLDAKEGSPSADGG